MNRFKRRRARTSDPLLPGPTFSTRQTTAMVVAILLAVVLVPVGAQAAQVVGAIITDPGGTNKATVDAGGNLHVAGVVTVDSSTPVAITSADDPGRMAFAAHRVVLFSDSDPSLAQATFDIPEGKRLVITYVSGGVLLPTGEKPYEAFLSTRLAGGGADYDFVPTFTGPVQDRDAFAFSQNTVIYADQEFVVGVLRGNTVGIGQASFGVSGYLIDCTAAPCN